MGVLADILKAKEEELGVLRAQKFPTPPPRRAVELRRSGDEPLRLIAEIKLRSPSAGPLSSKIGVAERAVIYEVAGATAISVLTDTRYFGGYFRHLEEVRAVSELPILCKDFVIDEIQLDAARAYGADLVLLIVRCLEPKRVGELVRGARERELLPMVEVATEEEAKIAFASGASIVGVNARDLDSLSIDRERAARVLAGLRHEVVRVHLSGISSPEDVERVAKSGVDAALIGETLMRLDDPKELLSAMVKSANSPPDAPKA